MPFKSQKQAKWMFANRPDMAKEWASKTPSIKELPNKVGKKNGKANSSAKKKASKK